MRPHREALATDPVLGPLADERDRRFRVEERLTDGDEGPPYLDVEAHRRELAACGFWTVEVPWRELDLALLAAIRWPDPLGEVEGAGSRTWRPIAASPSDGRGVVLAMRVRG